jgi:hypothetical protein
MKSAHAPRKSNDNGPAIDYYKNAEGWRPTNETTLGDLIDAIRSDEFAATVAEVREFIALGDKAAADNLKKTLPAVSLSGCVTGRRRAAVAEGRFTHSGLLQIDLDGKDNIGWSLDEMREILQADPRMVAVFVTPSGEGIKGVARIPADPSTHKSAFLAAEAHFKTLNIQIDPSCKDPVRLCFVSHDPDAWLRLDTDAMFEPVELELVEDAADDDHDEDDREPIPSKPMHHVSASGGLVIRASDTHQPLTLSTIREMLAVIPYPGYDGWLKIANAVWDAVGEEGTAALQEWAPEKKPGDYEKKFACRLQDVHAGTLVMVAKANGWAPTVTSAVAPRAPKATPSAPAAEPTTKKDKNLIPAHVFPVPAGDIGHDLASRHIFSIIGPTNRLFLRKTAVYEVAADEGDEFSLEAVPAKRLVSVIESFGCRVMRREMREDGTPRWRSTIFPKDAADVALSSDGAREFLPKIRQLVSAPVLVPDGDGTQVIGRGYHAHAGGTFVTSGEMPPVIGLDEAKTMILSMLEDFDFPDGGDASRAIASFISPAMKIGGWIEDDFPLDIAEADQSQSGKTYRQKLICAIYREQPSAITQQVGGVGSLDERVSTALIKGRPFISFDNFRGRMDSQILETAIRGLGKVSARALRIETDIDSTPFLWQLSTNGAELTRDLANRSIITRIRKRPDGHAFQTFDEGDILAHVRCNQPRFLGAVHAIVREWVAQGRRMTLESRHDFRTWCRVMDWIVQNIFEFPPLLDGHREEQMRTANPKLQWLRDVVHALVTDGHQGAALTASDLAECAEEHDLPIPGRRDTVEPHEVRVGKMLGRLFREAGSDTIIVDGRRFTRVIEMEYEPISRNHRERKSYVIEGEILTKEEDPQQELL